MLLQPDEYHSRKLKYAHLEKVGISALNQCGVFDSKLSFISDTGNVIFRSDTASHSYCVRIYQETSRSTPEIHGELYWLLGLRQSTNLIVPEPIMNSFGNIVQEISAIDDNKFQVVIFHWIPGDIIGSNLDAKTAQRMGALMARLHTHAENFDLPKGSFRDDKDWRGMGQFRANLDALEIARIESFLEKDQLTLCDEVARRTELAINEINIQYNFGLIHSDLHANNCLTSSVGNIGIIDFDDCQIAPFTCDIAITISSFDKFSNQEAFRSAFLQGYSENRELPKNHVTEIESFAMERRLRLLRWISTWENVDYFPFGRQMIADCLLHFRKYVAS